MRQKERQDSSPTGGSSVGGGSGDYLSSARERADRFLEAGDDAINRALANSDSEAFLRASRQQGGE